MEKLNKVCGFLNDYARNFYLAWPFGTRSQNAQYQTRFYSEYLRGQRVKNYITRRLYIIHVWNTCPSLMNN